MSDYERCSDPGQKDETGCRCFKPAGHRGPHWCGAQWHGKADSPALNTHNRLEQAP